MSKFFTLLTTVGEAKLANATALGQTVKFEKMAIGMVMENFRYLTKNRQHW